MERKVFKYLFIFRFTIILNDSKKTNSIYWKHGMDRLYDQIIRNISSQYIEQIRAQAEIKEKKTKCVAQVVDIEKLYKLGRKLGSGTFSTVLISQDKRTGERFAIKCIKKCKLSRDDLTGLLVYINLIYRWKLM